MNAVGWVAVVGIVLLLMVCFIGLYLDGQSSYRSGALQQEAQNQRELQEHRAVIDALYQRAEEEVRRRTQ